MDAVSILLATQFQNVTAGTLADSNNGVGLAESLPKLPLINLRVQPMVVFRVAQEDEVVNGDHATDAGTPQPHGQLARQPVIDGDAVGLQVVYDAARAPPGLAQRSRVPLGVAEVHPLDYLSTQLVTPFVRSIEAQLHVAVAEPYQVVDQRTSVATQSCSVAHDALGVNTYYHTKSSPYLICISLTYLRTIADESPFLQMSNTLPCSATI